MYKSTPVPHANNNGGLDMKEFNYLAEKKRMVESLSDGGSGCYNTDCAKCPLSSLNNNACPEDGLRHIPAKQVSCHDFELMYPMDATELVRVWAEEHPRKTLTNALLKAFPNAKLYSSGVPMTCARKLGLVDDCIVISENRVCEECWNQEVEEDQ